MMSSTSLEFSKKIFTSGTKTEGGHCNHTTDMQAELRRMASFYVDPAQQSMFISEMDNVLQKLLPISYAEPEILEPENNVDSLVQANESFLCGSKKLVHDGEASFIRKIPLGKPRNYSQTVGFSITQTLLGTIYLKSIVHKHNDAFFRENHDSVKDRYETYFVLHPATWLLHLGARTGFNGSFSTAGWKHTLETFRAVPDDSLIFEFCADGNLDGIKALLNRGEASVWDRDSFGQTPLHVSAFSQFGTHQSLLDIDRSVGMIPDTKVVESILRFKYEFEVDKSLPTYSNVVLKGVLIFHM